RIISGRVGRSASSLRRSSIAAIISRERRNVRASVSFFGGAMFMYHFDVDIVAPCHHNKRTEARDPTLLLRPDHTRSRLRRPTMADAFPITTRLPSGTPAALQPTAVMGDFSQLLIALATLVEAERDLEHFDIWDLATDHWLREAEEAFTRVTTLVHRIRNAAPARLEDRKLQRVTTLLDTMIGSEQPGTFQRFHAKLHRFDW